MKQVLNVLMIGMVGYIFLIGGYRALEGYSETGTASEARWHEECVEIYSEEYCK